MITIQELIVPFILITRYYFLQRLIIFDKNIKDDRFLPFIYELDDKDEWDKEDRFADEYLAEKNKINQLLGKPEYKNNIFAATEMWIDKNIKWGDKDRAVEAVREVPVSMCFTGTSRPISFARLATSVSVSLQRSAFT